MHCTSQPQPLRLPLLYLLRRKGYRLLVVRPRHFVLRDTSIRISPVSQNRILCRVTYREGFEGHQAWYKHVCRCLRQVKSRPDQLEIDQPRVPVKRGRHTSMTG